MASRAYPKLTTGTPRVPEEEDGATIKDVVDAKAKEIIREMFGDRVTGHFHSVHAEGAETDDGSGDEDY